jgi:erythromycin esterase
LPGLTPLIACDATAPDGDSTLDSNTARVEWLEENALLVRTVNPDDVNWTDLEPLKAEIGDARIVMLGEQSHGDGTTFLAKARLIKFFHQEMGFDVLAFESGLFEMQKAWQLIQQGWDTHTAVGWSVYLIWTGSEQFQPLADYVDEAAASPRPLELAGFDCYFSDLASHEFFVEDLTALLVSINSPIVQDTSWSIVAGLLQALVDHVWREQKPTVQEKALFDSTLARIQREVEENLSVTADSNMAFWSQLMESTAAQAQIDWRFDPAEGDTREQGVARDRQMGDNFIWLARNKYPDRKILVWAATYHVVRNIEDIEFPISPGSYDGSLTMGHVVWRELGPAVYVLGFTAYEGEKGAWWNQSTRISRPRPGSLESLLHQAGSAYAFVDFRSIPAGGEWLHGRLMAQPLGYGHMIAHWPRHMDGMFFTHTMEPSTRAGG